MTKESDFSSGVKASPSIAWRNLFPLPWSRLLPSVTWISAANGEHAIDIRGWGYMTGTGGGLAMSPNDAIAVQSALADEVVRRINAHDDLVSALRVVTAELEFDELHTLVARTGTRRNVRSVLERCRAVLAKCKPEQNQENPEPTTSVGET